jgi:hypothetical protein
MMLSGQEYVDEYAAKVKKEMAAGDRSRSVQEANPVRTG